MIKITYGNNYIFLQVRTYLEFLFYFVSSYQMLISEVLQRKIVISWMITLILNKNIEMNIYSNILYISCLYTFITFDRLLNNEIWFLYTSNIDILVDEKKRYREKRVYIVHTLKSFFKFQFLMLYISQIEQTLKFLITSTQISHIDY